jgi:DNA-binding YbaB/EbfC family protein
MNNLNKLMKQAQQMQAQMAAAQAELAVASFTAEAAGGMVSVTLTGGMDMQAVKIAPEAIADGDAEMLEDMITAAFRAAQESVRKASEEKLGPLTGGMGLPGM